MQGRWLRRTTAAVCAAAWFTAVATSASAQDGFDPTGVERVRVGGDQFAYRTVGSGPPLVMVTGFGGTMAEWDPALIAPLAESHRVIVFDNRGAGDSAGMSVAGLSVERMADETAAIIRKLAGGRADLLGWSMGGYIAQEVALDHPRRVRSLVLAGTDPGSPHAELPAKRVAEILNDPKTTPGDLLRILFPSDEQEAGRAWFGRLTAWPDASQQSFEVAPATLRAQGRAQGKPWIGRGAGTYSRLRRLRAPTLVAGGADDVVVPPSNFGLLARRVPGSRLELFPHAGHAFLFQDHARFAALVDGFLG